MLFAACSSQGREALASILRAVAAAVGSPAETLLTTQGVLCTWSSRSLDSARQQCVDGCARLEGQLSLDTIGGAQGDFVLLALRAGGVLAASGNAGGNRPIYVARIANHTAVFSSHLAPLLASLPHRPGPDPDYLAAALALQGAFRPGATPYLGVRRIPAGEAWLATPTGEERRSTVRPLTEGPLRGDPRELAVQFREELEGAIHRSTAGAHQVGVLTSGGLDSSSILALLVGLSRRGLIPCPPVAYSLEFDAPRAGDDRPHRRALESHLDLSIERLTVDQFPIFSTGDFVVDAAPAPLPTLPLLAELGRKASRNGLPVLISGTGGDDVVDGAPVFFAQLAQKGHPISAARSFHRLRGIVGFTRRRRWRDLFFKPLLRPLFPSWLRRANRRSAIVSRHPWAGPRLRAQLELTANVPYTNATLDESPAARYERLLGLPVFRLTSVARLQEESAGGHTRRDPFLDDDFLRFVARIPPLALMHGDFCRGLLRESMRGLLPESLRLREDKAPLEPACTAMVEKAGGFKILESLSRVPLLADAKLVEPKAFQEHFARMANQPLQPGWPHLWVVLAAEAFLRRMTSPGDVP